MPKPGDSTNLAGAEFIFPKPHDDEHFLKIKVPPIPMNLRRSVRHSTASAGASGSEYLASEKSVEMHEEPPLPPEPPVEIIQSRSGRRMVRRTYVESSDSELAHPGEMMDEEPEDRPLRKSRLPRTRRPPPEDIEDEDEDEAPMGYRLRNRNRHDSFIVDDDDGEMHGNGRYPKRNRTKKPPPKPNGSSKPQGQQSQASQRSRRLTRRNASRADQEEDFFPEPHTSSGASADADGSIDDAPHTSSDLEPEPEPEPEHEPEQEEDGRPYALRQRQKINYAIPPPLEDIPKPPPKNAAGRNGGRAGGYHGGGHGRAGGKGRSLGWSASGAELGRWMGMPGDDSVIIFLVSLGTYC